MAQPHSDESTKAVLFAYKPEMVYLKLILSNMEIELTRSNNDLKWNIN